MHSFQKCCTFKLSKKRCVSLWYSVRCLKTFTAESTYRRRRCFILPSSPWSTSSPLPRILDSVVSRLSAPQSSSFHLLARHDAGVPHGGISVDASSSPGDFPKSRPKSDDTWRLLRLVESEKMTVCGAVGLLVISSAVTMSVPFLMGKVIDIINASVAKGSALDALNPMAEILLAVFLAGALANAGRVYLIQTSGHRIVANLRISVMSAIMKKEMSFFDRTRTGELISRLASDTNIVGQALTQNLSDGLRSSVMCLASGSMMLYISPQLSGISLLSVAPVAVFSIIYGRRLRNLSKQLQDRVANSTSVAEERISNVRTVKAFAQELEEIKNYQEKNSSVLDVAYKDSGARAVFFGVNALVGNVIVLVVFYYGGMMMQNSAITVGEISSFLVYAAYMGFGLGDGRMPTWARC